MRKHLLIIAFALTTSFLQAQVSPTIICQDDFSTSNNACGLTLMGTNTTFREEITSDKFNVKSQLISIPGSPWSFVCSLNLPNFNSSEVDSIIIQMDLFSPSTKLPGSGTKFYSYAITNNIVSNNNPNNCTASTQFTFQENSINTSTLKFKNVQKTFPNNRIVFGKGSMVSGNCQTNLLQSGEIFSIDNLIVTLYKKATVTEIENSQVSTLLDEETKLIFAYDLVGRKIENPNSYEGFIIKVYSNGKRVKINQTH